MSSTEQMVDRVESHVSKQLRPGYQDKKTNDTKKECQYCGYSHEPCRRRCPAWGKICSHCHGPNHFKAKCRKKINCVLETDDPENDDDWLQAHALTFGVTGDAKQKRITAMMEVNQCSIRFQLDTGADINTINQIFVRKDQVRQTGEKLVMWNGTKLTQKGTAKLMKTNVKTGTKDEVDFVVVDNGLTCLIGSTTTQAMGRMTIHGERFISKVDNVDDLGNLGMATLITDCDIAPKILPCRKIPIALQQGVKTELDTLVKRGILVPVDEQEAMRDIHNTSISETLDDFDCFKKRGLHFVHLNARSILPKMEELDILALSTKAAIIAVTETWLDNTICDNDVCIPGYSIQRKDRNREGGGVCIFIRNNINFNRRSDIDKDDLEFLAIDIMMPKSKPIILGVGYRPPRDNMFYAKLEEVLSSCTNFVKQECYILGDFNTDVLAERNVLKNDFENFLRIFDLKQVITEPTRITDTSETAIDLICTYDVENISQSGVLPCKLSDHNVIFLYKEIDEVSI